MEELNSRSNLFIECKFNRNVFIETGTHSGDGVKAAIECKFEKIISFEIETKLQNKNRIKFKDNKNVDLITGDSGGDCFKNVVGDLTESALFWLDAHKQPDQNHDGKNPLYQELFAICNSLYNHVILIDDVRNFGLPVFDVSVDSLLKFIDRYGRRYKTRFGSVRNIKNDVLIIEFVDC